MTDTIPKDKQAGSREALEESQSRNMGMGQPRQGTKMSEGVDAAMPFLKHLEELRNRLIKCLIAVGIAFSVCYGFSERLFEFLMKPLCWSLSDTACRINFTGLSEPFLVYLKVGLLGGFLAASPYILFQVWRFVAPGLYKRERRLLWPFVSFSTIFFVGGALFGYFAVFPFGFRFFLSYASPTVQPLLTMSEYLTLASSLLMIFGLVFELPLLLLFLSFLHLVNSRQLLVFWRYAIVIISIVSAVVTPTTDPWTMLLMMGPLIGLYFFSIFLIRLFETPA